MITQALVFLAGSFISSKSSFF